MHEALGKGARARDIRLKGYDLALAGASVVASRVARAYRRRLTQTSATARVWEHAGVLPVPYHYYEPVIGVHTLKPGVWTRDNGLAGIDLRIEEQFGILEVLAPYAGELMAAPRMSLPGVPEFSLSQTNFGPGDADCLYAMVRHATPRRVLEIGSGYSTLLVQEALRRNARDGRRYEHTCVEPFEMPWLEGLGVEVVRTPVEDVDPGRFAALGDGDVLFIDSSHVVRTGGDVTHLILDVLPSLRPGVYVHFHDIFLPRHYPREWVVDMKRFWTEQYLLQAFLAFNREFEVVLALSCLALRDRDRVAAALPLMARHEESVPGSFWIRRTGAA